MPIIRYTLESDTAGFNSGMGGATSSMAGATNMAGKLSAGILALGASVKKLTDFVVDTVDEVNTLSKSSGLTTAQVNGLRLAAKATGKELKDIVPKNLARNLRTAATTGGTMAKAFEDAGVEFKNFDGSMRESSEVFPELIQSLSEMENRTDAAAIAAELMGRKGGELLSAFDDTAGFQHFVDLGNEFGIRTGPEAVKAAGEWQEATGTLALAFEHAGQKLLDAFGGPGAIAEMVNGFSVGMTFLVEAASRAAELIALDFKFAGLAIDAALKGDWAGAVANANMVTSATDKLKLSLKAGFEQSQKFFELTIGGAEGAGEAIEEEEEDVNDLADAFKAAEQAAADLVSIQESMGTLARQIADDEKTDAARAIERNVERLRLIGEQERALIKLGETGTKVEADLALAAINRLESEARLRRDMDALDMEAMAAITQMMDEAQQERTDSFLKSIATMSDAEDKLAKEQIALRSMVRDVSLAIANELALAVETFAVLRQEQLTTEIGMLQERADVIRADIEQMIEGGVVSTEVEEAKLKSLEDSIAARGAALKRAFAAEQVAAVSSILTQGASAYLGLLAAFAPLALGAPIAAAAITGPAVAAQLGVVAAQKPPTLHGGTANSDEVMATIRSRESVVSQRGSEAIGRDTIDAANNGQPMSSGGGVNQIVFQRRVLDTMMSRTIRGGGATSRLIARGKPPSGIVDPFGGV